MQLPAAGEGLAWIANTAPHTILLRPGLQAGTILAAAAGDEQALAALIQIAQQYVPEYRHQLCSPAAQQETLKVMRKAAGQGKLAALMWLQALCLPFSKARAGLMAAAASEGQLHIMRYLRAAPHPAPWTLNDSHCAQSHPACLKWLLEQDPPCPSDGLAITALCQVW